MKISSPNWIVYEYGTICERHHFEIYGYCRQCAAEKCPDIELTADDYDSLAILVGDATSYRDFLPANGDLDYLLESDSEPA